MQDSLQGIRLSLQQKHLWLLQQHQGEYCAQTTVQLEGLVDETALQASINRVVARHEIFRTTFRREPGIKVPFQVIEPSLPPRWCVLDWRGRDPVTQQADVAACCEEQRRRQVDLEHGPLLDIILIRLADRRSVMLIALPALCADAVSLDHFVRETALGYAPRPAGEPSDDGSDAPVQYVQFSEWQNELLADEEAEQGRAYWRRIGLTATVPLRLPYEQPISRIAEVERSALQSVFVLSIALETLATLDALAQAHAASREEVLLACWQLLLSRVTGRCDWFLVVSDTGRRYDELQDTMGPLATWVPIQCQLDLSMPFSSLLAAVQEFLSRAREQQEYFTWDEAAGQGPAALDPVGFRCDRLPARCKAGELCLMPIDQYIRDHRWKLTLACLNCGDEVRTYLEYDPERVSLAYVRCLADQFRTLVRGLAEQPERAVRDLTLLSDAERDRLMRPNPPVARQSEDATYVLRRFEAFVGRMPDALAVRCGDRQMTYAELNIKANQVAHALIRRGVGPDVPVGLCVKRSVDMLIGLLGILKAGGAYVPLDSDNSAARLAYQMAHANAPVMVTQEQLLPVMSEWSGSILCLDRDVAMLRQESPATPECRLAGEHLAYVIYTSGSTGVPKGVAVTHRGVANYTKYMCTCLGLEAGRHFATVSTIGADLGNTVIFASLSSGGCLHIIGYETATDASRFAEYMARHPIDVLKIVPSHLYALLASSEGKRILPREWLILGGEALGIELATTLGRIADCRIINHYGPTETTIGTLTSIWDRDGVAQLRGLSTVPIGCPIAGSQAYVLDQAFSPVAVGMPGELYIGGIGVARGYLHQAEQTAERFVPDPFSGRRGARLYRTGDSARYLPDGTVEYLGRLDQQVKIRGYRVELGEIESRLRGHPDVQEVLVTACDHGAGGTQLAAYVIPRPGRSLDTAALREMLKRWLPAYMLPAVFVFMRAFPLTPNGKIDRQALPPPERSGQRRIGYVAPRSPTEQILADIWRDLLKVPEVGVEDNFFDLGGHSLLAIQMMHRVQNAVGHSVSLTAIFQAPTVAGLAGVLRDGAAASASPLVVLRAGGGGFPLYCCDPTGRHMGAYQAIAESLKEARPVYGLNLSHLFQRNWRELSIHSIADWYAELICGHQPVGPYFLLGWSLGGVIALAVARSLQERGRSVAFLGILDTQARTGVYADQEPDVLDELAAFLDRGRRDEFRALPVSERAALGNRLAALPLEDRIVRAARWAMDQGFLPDDIPIETIHLRYALLKDAAMLLHAYERQPLDVPIHAWWTKATIGADSRPPLQWCRYTRGAVETAVVAGDHLDIINNADVHRTIAATLARLDSGK